MTKPALNLDLIPVGEQPEENGRLLCRLCGRWYRALGHHLLRKHDTSVSEYQERFELLASRGLAATDLREKQAQRGSDLVATNAAVQKGFLFDEALPSAEVLAERQRRAKVGRQGLAQKRTRAGVRASWVEHGRQLGGARREWAAQRRNEIDAEAREHDYADFADFVDQTRHLTHRAFAALLGWPGSEGLARATWWRLQYGGTSRFYEVGAQQRDEEQRAGLEQVPAGEQPADGQGQLRCLECGRWFVDLFQHLRAKHHLTAPQYRQLHELAEKVPLRSEECRNGEQGRLATLARKGAEASGRLKSETARRRYDELARQHGYTDFGALLATKTNAEVTVLLGLSRGQAYRVRQRYRAQTAQADGAGSAAENV